MARPKKEVEVEESVEDTETTDVVEDAGTEASEESKGEVDVEESKNGSVTVYYLGQTRTYSKEIHGKEYKNLAKQFASQYPGAVIK